MALSSSLLSTFGLKSLSTQSHSRAHSIEVGLPLKCTKNVHTKRNAQLIVNRAAQTTQTEVPERRTGNYHSNLWDDDYIQSLPRHPYQGPQYAERRGKLISEVKQLFSSEKDVRELLALVDNIERLGIDRHFQEEIKAALDLVYKNWGECQRDLNTTALGFRVLRLHRYTVSSGVFGAFRTANGQFFCSAAQSEEEEIKSVVNLYRASFIAFPGEKILDEAKHFSTQYLREALYKTGINSSLSREVSVNLRYPWYSFLPRSEARNYIEIYGEDNSWARVANNEKLLSLAKMDFNMVQSVLQQELKAYSRWWRESGLANVSFARHRHIEYFCMACAICEDEKYYGFRSTLAKSCTFATYIDDAYDLYGRVDELELITKAIKKWDLTSIDEIPEYMKTIYMVFCNEIIEMDREAQKFQGRETISHAKDAWEAYIDAMLQEAKWNEAKTIPTLAKHIENGIASCGTRATIVQPILTVDGILVEDMLRKIDYPSQFDKLVGLSLRLRGDIMSFKREVENGEGNSSIVSYMKDNPGSTEEDAVNYLENLLHEKFKELNWENLKNDGVPTHKKDYAYDIGRGFQWFYNERDGFSVSHHDMRDHAYQILIKPIPV